MLVVAAVLKDRVRMEIHSRLLMLPVMVVRVSNTVFLEQALSTLQEAQALVTIPGLIQTVLVEVCTEELWELMAQQTVVQAVVVVVMALEEAVVQVLLLFVMLDHNAAQEAR